MDVKKKVITLESRKFASMGPDFVIIIPRKLIKYGVIDPNKLYNIHFEEITENEFIKKD